MVKCKRAVFPWVGGKGRPVFLNKLLQYIPKHNVYVEVFGGAASLLLNKELANIEVYNDLNMDLVNFFRVIRDESKSKKLYSMLGLTPYSRSEFWACKMEILNRPCPSRVSVERAWTFFVVMRQGFSGFAAVRAGWKYNKVSDQSLPAWLNSIKYLPEIAQRFRKVYIDNKDFREVISNYDSADTFFYIDPPYLNVDQELYEKSMTYRDHAELIQLLLLIKGKVLLSGYSNRMYKRLERHGWRRKDFVVSMTAMRGKGYSQRVESLWASPSLTINILGKGKDAFHRQLKYNRKGLDAFLPEVL